VNDLFLQWALHGLAALLLVLQGAMGAIDTLYNHEWKERLAHRREARGEIGLHALREAIYAALFTAIGWFSWHGDAVWVIAGLLVAEVMVTACDEFIENRIRVLPQNERVLHVFLTLNMGAIIAVLAMLLTHTGSDATAVTRVVFPTTWLLTLLAVSSAAWAVRDLVAWIRLGRTA
jgi:hypothetical protein